jgi:methionyl-tRNA formyltransferase
MKIILFGTGDFGIPVLTMLKNEGMDVTLVTNPARPKGRGLKTGFSDIYNASLAVGIPVVCEENIRSSEFIDRIAALHPQLLIVVDYGKIIPVGLINIPGCRAINIHPSLLPLHRGATPIQTTLLNGDKETGVTVQTLAEKVDAGDILYQDRMLIRADDDYQTLGDRLKEVSVQLMRKLLADPDHKGIKQDPTKVTLCRKIRKEDLIVDWRMSATLINNHVRAFHAPQPGMRTLFRGKGIRLIKTEVKEEITGSEVLPGTIISLSKDNLVVGSGANQLSLIELQPENKKAMKMSDFINGYRPKTGEIFGV